MRDKTTGRGRAALRSATVALIVSATAITAVPAASPAAAVDAGAAERDVVADEVILAAVQRDLGLDPAAAADLLARQATAGQLIDQLTATLGEGYAGAWLDSQDGRPVVAVTAPVRTGEVRRAGAVAVVVEHSLAELATVATALDELARTDLAALDGVTGWAVDPAANEVVVTMTDEPSTLVSDLLDGYEDLIRLELTDTRPVPAVDYLDGGVGYNTCSVGFNVTVGGVGHFLTAGHCDPQGANAVRNGVPIGPVVQAWFPEYDDGLVRNDNPGYWLQGPWVSTHTPDNPDLVYELSGHRDSPVGTVVCKSGRTTHLTCGRITGKNQTVVYEDGVVYGLTRHNACVEPGDSGGATISVAGDGRYFAEGMTSGAQLESDGTRLRCLSHHGGSNVSWFQPIGPPLAFYGATLLTAG